MELSPIVLFVYNRPWHTRRTIEALLGNDLASASRLVIYSDAPKDDNAVQGVNEVREYIHTVTGFRDVTITERDTNWGLSKSVIEGVTGVIQEHGKIIVVEDDIVTSPYFLKFMNEALDFYQHQSGVWHVSGWNYPVESNHPEDTFLWRVMNCWGWATWADRWSLFEKNAEKLVREWNKDDIKRFNLDGATNFWWQVEANYSGQINTWAIFWYATIFRNNGLCLNPAQTFVDNIGHDGSGVHCGNRKPYIDSSNQSDTFSFPTAISESEQYLKKIKHHLHTPLLRRIRRRLMRHPVKRLAAKP